jgi:hypothetical protein
MASHNSLTTTPIGIDENGIPLGLCCSIPECSRERHNVIGGSTNDDVSSE